MNSIANILYIIFFETEFGCLESLYLQLEHEKNEGNCRIIATKVMNAY